MSGRLVRLYPEAWRDRYGAEFTELLATRPPGLADRIDILRGAIDAHRHPQVARPREVVAPGQMGNHVRLARNLGFGTVAGAGLWAMGWIVVLLGPVRYDGYGAYRDGSAAFPILLGAIALIAGGLGGQLVSLPPEARLARAGAALALPFMLVWGSQPWLLWAGGVTIGGLAILAVGGHRSRAWPTWSSVSVALACLVGVVLVAYGLSRAVDRMAGGILLTFVAAAFVPAWLGLAATLLRGRVAWSDAR